MGLMVHCGTLMGQLLQFKQVQEPGGPGTPGTLPPGPIHALGTL